MKIGMNEFLNFSYTRRKRMVRYDQKAVYKADYVERVEQE